MQAARARVEDAYAKGEAIECLALDDPLSGWHCAKNFLQNHSRQFQWDNHDYRVLASAKISGVDEPEGVIYGIIDPDYARVFTIARCLAWAEGYALMMHGSFTRDLDLIAIPWTESACAPEHLLNRILDAANLRITAPDTGDKPHGRMACTLKFKTFGDPRFIDLSITPRMQAAATASATGGVDALMQLARNWCLAWGEWSHDADPNCEIEKAAEAELRAALTAALKDGGS